MSVAVTEQSQTESSPAVLRNLASNASGKTVDGAVQKTLGQRAFQAAEDSAEFFDHMRAHYRETRRTCVEIPCEIKVLFLDGTLCDTGRGVLRNVSPSGALIGALHLAKGGLPLQSFKLVLALTDPAYNGISIEALPVRLAPEAGGLGVKFQEIFVAV